MLETSTFITSMFGGGTGQAPGKSSTISEGCQRMGMNVSYMDVLTRIKAKEDHEEDARHLKSSTRSSILDPSRDVKHRTSQVDTQSNEQSSDFDSRSSSVNPSLDATALLETSALNSAMNSTSFSSVSSSISQASELLGLSVNNTIQKYGPPDELGKYALIPRGPVNFAALQTTTECLCQTTTEGRGEFDLQRNHHPNHPSKSK